MGLASFYTALGAAIMLALARLRPVSDDRFHEDDSPGDKLAEDYRISKLAELYHGDTTAAAIMEWRIRNLVSAGFDELRAATIAATDSDWRRAIDLVERGCDPVVAADIVL